jgi:ankyrin repeat protein
VSTTDITIRHRRSWWVLLSLSAAALAAASVNLSAADTIDLRLIQAVKRGDKEATLALLKQHVNVNAPQGDGSTALFWAVDREDQPTAELLIGAGANVNVANEYGVTPLLLACTKANAAIAEILLKAGANPNAAPPSGETPLMTAAGVGSVEIVTSLLARDADVRPAESRRGQTALMWASAERHPQVARLLLEHGANINGRSKGGFTALLFAAQQGDLELARILLAAGADANGTLPAPAPSTSSSGQPQKAAPARTPAILRPLLIAAGSGNGAVASLLLEQGADPNVSDARGFTPLHYAAQRRDMPDLLKALVAHKANLNALLTKSPPSAEAGTFRLDTLGGTPLLVAAAAGNVNAVRALAASGADLRIPTHEHITPLMAAAGVGRFDDRSEDAARNAVETVKALLELDADVTAVDDHGWTALHGAAYMGAIPTIQLLVAKGAKLDLKDKYGQTPLSIAGAVITTGLVQSSDASVRPRAVHKSAADLLLKLGATPLAASGVEVVEMLPENYSVPVTKQ